MTGTVIRHCNPSPIKTQHFLRQPQIATFCVGGAKKIHRPPKLERAPNEILGGASVSRFFSKKSAGFRPKSAKKSASLKCQIFYCIVGRFWGDTKINLQLFKKKSKYLNFYVVKFYSSLSAPFFAFFVESGSASVFFRFLPAAKPTGPRNCGIELLFSGGPVWW